MAAGQLPLFRSLCRAFHNFVTANERPVVFSALMNDKYRTRSRLYYRHIYYPRLPQNALYVADLYQLARRCDSTPSLALLNHLLDLIRTSKTLVFFLTKLALSRKSRRTSIHTSSCSFISWTNTALLWPTIQIPLMPPPSGHRLNNSKDGFWLGTTKRLYTDYAASTNCFRKPSSKTSPGATL